jgi:general nucleoside transport system permease protein
VSERVGVVNIGLEGMMTLGTWGAGFFGWHWGPWAALVGGMLFGALGGLLHALVTVTFGVDHIVSGVAINIIASGVTRFLASQLFVGKSDGSITQSPTMTHALARVTMPLLSGGKLGGWRSPDPLGWLVKHRWFFVSDVAGLLKGLTSDVSLTTIIAVAMVPVVAYVLWHTRAGLRLRSIGERPSAADSLGVNVVRIKYVGVIISGALAGLGGAWLANDVRIYQEGQVANRGFLGLASLIFGNWRPSGVLSGAGILSFAQALSYQNSDRPVRAIFLIAAAAFALLLAWFLYRRRFRRALLMAGLAVLVFVYYASIKTVNQKIVFIIPYIVTLVVVTFASGRLRPPAAEGKPWRKGDLG